MTHFVQRLLARHLAPVAQVRPGSGMMLPRMASRFEGALPSLPAEIGGKELLGETYAERPVAVAPSTDHPLNVASNMMAAPKSMHQAPQEPRMPEALRSSSATSTNLADNPHPVQRIVTVPTPNLQGDEIAERAIEVATSADQMPVPEPKTVMPLVEVQLPPELAQQEPSIGRKQQQQHRVDRNVSSVAPTVQSMPEGITPAAEIPQPPQISIGRIDVQFLPPAAPVVQQRPAVQRTRGFDAYANARRGLVR